MSIRMLAASMMAFLFATCLYAKSNEMATIEAAIEFITNDGTFTEVNRYFVPSFVLGSDTLPDPDHPILSAAKQMMAENGDYLARTFGQVDDTWYGGPGMTPEKNLAFNVALAIGRANIGAAAIGSRVLPSATVFRSPRKGPEERGVWIVIFKPTKVATPAADNTEDLEERIQALALAYPELESRVKALELRPQAYWSVGPGWSDGWNSGWSMHTPTIAIRRHRGPYTVEASWGRAFYASGRQDDIRSITITREFERGLIRRWDDNFGLGLEFAEMREWASEAEGAGDYWMCRAFGGGISGSYEVWASQKVCLTLKAGLGYADFEERIPVISKSGAWYFKDAAIISIHLF